jgi:hypothetical protein
VAGSLRSHRVANAGTERVVPLTLSLLAVGILPSSADPCGSMGFNLREVGPWKIKGSILVRIMEYVFSINCKYLSSPDTGPE